jgi:hypothetical protein
MSTLKVASTNLLFRGIDGIFSLNNSRWSIRLSVEAKFGFMRIVFMNFVILYRICVTNELIGLVCTDCRSCLLSSLMTYHHGIVFMNFVCVTNEHWYVWFVLIAGHVFCFRSWLVTMCDIWPVVGISSIMNVTCGTGPYLPSYAFVSNSNFNLVPVAHNLVF